MTREEINAILDGKSRTSVHYGRDVAIYQGELEEIFAMARIVHGLSQWSAKFKPLQPDSNMLPPCF